MPAQSAVQSPALALRGYFTLPPRPKKSATSDDEAWRPAIQAIFCLSKSEALIVTRYGTFLYDLKEQETLWEIHCPTKSMALGSSGAILALGFMDDIFVWSLRDGALMRCLRGHTGQVDAVAISPDNMLLASAGHDTYVRLWDISSGKEVYQFQREGYSGPEAVTKLAIGPDGHYLAMAGGSINFDVHLWHVTLRCVALRLAGHTAPVRYLAFHPSGHLLTASKNELVLWDVNIGREARRFPAAETLTVAVSPEGSRLATGIFDGQVQLWDVATGRKDQLFNANGTWPVISFGPDGCTLAAASSRGVQIWDVGSGHELYPCEAIDAISSPVSGIAWSPDSSVIAVAGLGKSIRLVNPATGQELKRVSGHSAKASCVAFSPDGHLLASGSHDHTMRLWDLDTGKEVQRLALPWSVMMVTFSRDGRQLVCAGGSRVVVSRIGSQDRPSMLADDGFEIKAISFSADGQYLAIGRECLLASTSPGPSNSICILHLPDWTEVAHMVTGYNVSDVTFSPSDNRLVGGGKLCEFVPARFLRPATIRPIRDCGGTCVAFAPSGNAIATASSNVVVLWNLATGKELHRWEADSTIQTIAFSPNGRYLAVGIDGGMIRIWKTT